VALQRGGSRRRGIVGPQHVTQPIGGDHLAVLREERREHEPGLLAADAQHLVAAPRFHRSQHAQ
jgi:hypothetical protein